MPASLGRRDVRATPARQARLERLVQQDYDVIWRLLRRSGVPASVAEDAAQQVFLIAAERLDDIKAGSERAFAYGTALRVAKSLNRKQAREVVGAEAERNACPRPSPEALSNQKQARDVLDRLLASMPPRLRTVFILFELEGMTSPEIAELTGVPLGTVASRLRRARAAFRRKVRREKAKRGGV